MKAKRYITQITAEDMRELAAVTNLKPGFLIRIDKGVDGVKISIDQKALALALNGFYRNGGMDTPDLTAATQTPFNPPY